MLLSASHLLTIFFNFSTIISRIGGSPLYPVEPPNNAIFIELFSLGKENLSDARPVTARPRSAGGPCRPG